MKLTLKALPPGMIALALAWSGSAHANGYGQLSISTPSNGATYGSTSNVSTSVSYSNACSSCGMYLDRRVFNAATSTSSATGDTCYFSGVTLSATSGTVTGTLRDGSGSASSSYSSASCFTGGTGADYVFVATIVTCDTSAYADLSSCIEDGTAIVARSTRFFSHD